VEEIANAEPAWTKRYNGKSDFESLGGYEVAEGIFEYGVSLYSSIRGMVKHKLASRPGYHCEY
jgi:hypothetical protein